MNIIKGFDRIAILLTIPLSIWGAYHSYCEFTNQNKIQVFLTEEEENELENSYRGLFGEKNIFTYIDHKQVFSSPKNNGIIAEGEKELYLQSTRNHLAKSALDRAYEWGGDQQGTLVEDREWDNLHSRYILYLLPRNSKRLIAGFFGAIYYTATIALGIILFTRIISRSYRWIKNGFLSS
jgi:hypothetical protein